MKSGGFWPLIRCRHLARDSITPFPDIDFSTLDDNDDCDDIRMTADSNATRLGTGTVTGIRTELHGLYSFSLDFGFEPLSCTLRLKWM